MADLVQILMQQDLVDQYNLWVYPVLLGNGKRLFGDGTIPTALRLVESRTFGNGAVLLSYGRSDSDIYRSHRSGAMNCDSSAPDRYPCQADTEVSKCRMCS
jgi:dihydrofolate reductase